MGDLLTLPRPNRTRDDDLLDMPACGIEWGTGDCTPVFGQPRRHACWTWTGWPHICRCTRCEVGRRA